MKNPIVVGQNTSVSHLLWAINHYVSTGDRIGEGVVDVIGDGKLRVYIPVNPRLEDDRKDFGCFRERFSELADAYQMQLTHLGSWTGFEMWGFEISANRVEALATELLDRPGPRGWGSMKDLIGME